ncbi:hypothetical protein RSOLAG22IIIB_12159 [Rhizoctonia solani]|uniref:Uncharacterized protein n=1 Tax=Rhizoctonia solani TaxID=456999 RepID=A0A0K6GCB1_9AGAM|nr:hypothetical protein RSOLAG22IIIB_12159 [Rhizoctonia solani]
MQSLHQHPALYKAREYEFYLANESISERVVWVTQRDQQIDVAVPIRNDGSKANPSDTPIVFSGIFQIMPSMFFCDASLGINGNKPHKWVIDQGLKNVLAEGRASFVAIPVSSTYPDLNADYPRYIKNLDQVLKLAIPRCSQEGLRIEDSKGTTALKMRHRMFEEREEPCYVNITPKDDNKLARKKGALSEDVNESRDHDSDTRGIVHVDDLDDDIIPEFRIHNLPVDDECRKQLNQIIPTHTFNPLCAFDYGSETPILPADYRSKLRGAVAEIRFTLTHRILKNKEGVKSNFNAIVDEIIILGKPTQNTLAPSKVKNKKLFTRQPTSGSDTQGCPDNCSPNGGNVQNQPTRTADETLEGPRPKRTRNK